MNEDRRRSPGRRPHDHVLEVVWRELDELKKDLRRYLEEIKREVGKEIERVDGMLAELEEKLHKLAIFNIEDTARSSERLVGKQEQEHRRTTRWARVSVAIGALGTLFGILSALGVFR